MLPLPPNSKDSFDADDAEIEALVVQASEMYATAVEQQDKGEVLSCEELLLSKFEIDSIERREFREHMGSDEAMADVKLEDWLEFSCARLKALGLSHAHALYQTLQELIDHLGHTQAARHMPPSAVGLTTEQMAEPIQQAERLPRTPTHTQEFRDREKLRKEQLTVAKIKLEREAKRRREEELLGKLEAWGQDVNRVFGSVTDPSVDKAKAAREQAVIEKLKDFGDKLDQAVMISARVSIRENHKRPSY